MKTKKHIRTEVSNGSRESLFRKNRVPSSGMLTLDSFIFRNWLYEMYCKKQLSIRQIADEIKVSQDTIWKRLRKFNIPIRSSGKGVHLRLGNYCNLSQEAREWIDGELLGDGCLTSQSSCSASFNYSSKYSKYIKYISDTLNSFGIKRTGKIRKWFNGESNCGGYYYTSRCYPELLSIRQRWYPNGKKIIPRDLKLTPLTLRQEHLGDGSLIHQQKGKGRPYIQLSTHSFSINDVEWLIEKLHKLNFKATRQPSNNTIYISPYSVKDFLAYIGKCPIECYKYKWNYNKGEV